MYNTTCIYSFKDYFDGKPTERAYTSQVPYLEKFVGEPYVSIYNVYILVVLFV